MPAVSRRGDEMIHSPIRSLMPYARKAKEEGVKVFHLNIGQPDIETPEAALGSLREYEERIIQYGSSEGLLALRQVACDYYCKEVAAIDVEDIYVTTGASEAIMFTLFACFDPGSEIIIPQPFYANYIGFSHVSGVHLVPVNSTIANGFALPDTKDIEDKITPRTKAIFLCNPNNPTGNLYTKEELHSITGLVKKYDLFLIVDEVYREFCYDYDFYSVLNIEGLEDHVLVIDSISKVFSSCGSRIGFVVSRNRQLMANILKYAQLRLCPPMIGQHMAVSCFRDRASYLDKVRTEYDNRRQYLYDRLTNISGVTCYLPKAAFYIMTQLPIDDANAYCTWLLSTYRKDRKTIMMAPGHGFYLSRGQGISQVRIAFVLGIEALKEAMDILEDSLAVYPGRVSSHEAQPASKVG